MTTTLTLRTGALAALVGLAVLLPLAWIDPVFIPLVLAGPPISGALAAGQRIPFALVAVTWTSAGLGMLVIDWLVNREDVVFHLVLTVVMVVLAAAGWAPVNLVQRRREVSPRAGAGG